MVGTSVGGRGMRMAMAACLTAAMITGCMSSGSCASIVRMSPASASCAAGIEYQGHFYAPWSPRFPVAKGELLGDAVYPACNDEGGCGPADQPMPTRVWALRGADPDQVVLSPEASGRLVVFARMDVDPKDFYRWSGGAWHLRGGASGQP